MESHSGLLWQCSAPREILWAFCRAASRHKNSWKVFHSIFRIFPSVQGGSWLSRMRPGSKFDGCGGWEFPGIQFRSRKFLRPKLDVTVQTSSVAKGTATNWNVITLINQKLWPKTPAKNENTTLVIKLQFIKIIVLRKKYSYIPFGVEFQAERS